MTRPAGQRPPRLSNAGWLHEPLAPIAPPRPYPDGPVPPRPLGRWKQAGPGPRRLGALAAAICLAVLLLLGVLRVFGSDRRAEAVPDLRGYHHVDNLCAITDTAPYTRAGFALAPNGPTGPKYPLHQTLLHPAIDSMTCTIRLAPPASAERSEDVTLTVSTAVHKRTDPGPEFTARFETWTQSTLSEDDGVATVDGLGDEAYVVRMDSKHAPRRGVTLAVRDGWTTYEISWLHPPSVTTTTDLTVPEVVDLLKRTAVTTLALLRA
ncbi:hypothetical protein [Nocardia brasiliensis]|uniref:hypothetical protein n=1 Tax=Nocardia brasiliensis TaxID=37326 RepID=UPI00366E79D8